MANLKNTQISDTGQLQLPAGSTAQRPPNASAGMIRYNTTLYVTEYYDGSAWQPVKDSNPDASGGLIVDTIIDGIEYRIHYFDVGTANFVVNKGGDFDYLIVAGGGGSPQYGAGGGAGGLLQGTINLSTGTYSITVGAGGAKRTTSSLRGFPGENSTAFGFTAIGGGGGGAHNGSGERQGGNGGSGGGGGRGIGPGSGTAGQGNDGGCGAHDSAENCPGFTGGNPKGGGGGGAGAPGENATSFHGGRGGTGISSSITGDIRFYAGGGGGHSWNGLGALGGTGGGGIGGRNGASGALGSNTFYQGTDGAPNTGGGAGGGPSQTNGNAGGSGVVIVRYRKNSTTTTAANRTKLSSLPLASTLITLNGPTATPEVADNMLIYLDAGDPVSYPGSGTTWKSLQGGAQNRVLNGTILSTPTFSNNNGGYLDFPNTSDRHLSFPDLDAQTDQPLSAFFWVYYNGWTGSDSGVWGYNSENGNCHFEVRSSTSFRLRLGGANNSSLPPIPVGRWSYIGFTSTGTEHIFYIDGTRTASFTGNTGTILGAGLSVGRSGMTLGDSNRNVRPWNGRIATFNLYNKRLLPFEVEQNFNASKWRYGL